MTPLLITNAQLVSPGRHIRRGNLLVRNGRIAAVGEHANASDAGLRRVDGGGRLLTPGLIDVHTHGIERHMYELSGEGLRNCAAALGKYGTTTALPTLYTTMRRDKLAHLDELARALEQTHLPGFHLEGPFLALPGAGADTIPGDLGLLEDVLAACHRRVNAMSISPDTPNIIPVIERLREHGISVFITHTRASVDQTQAAIDAGATHATHFYDVFPLPPETDGGVRPVGAVETILANRHVTVDFIADGAHVHPMAIRAALAAKGFERIILITDSNIGAGLPPGVYDTPWGYAVRVQEGRGARHVDKNFLAGSALTMNRGMENLLRWLDLPPAQVWAMGTSNTARMLGLTDRGTLDVGARADLVLWNDNLQPAQTWVEGNCVYENQ